MHTLFLAAEQAAPMQFDWVPHVTTIVVFVIAFAILAVFVWPKITGALDARDAKILEEIRSAEQARADAKAALVEYQRSLADAEQQAQKVIAQAKADAQAVAAELRARNETELSELKARAMRDIQAAQQSAVKEVYDQAAQLAAGMASRILQREVNVGDQQRIVEEAIGAFDTPARKN